MRERERDDGRPEMMQSQAICIGNALALARIVAEARGSSARHVPLIFHPERPLGRV